MPSDNNEKDLFVDMVTKTARIELPLGDFDPQPCLQVPEHNLVRPKFPAIDAHCHIDAQPLDQVLRVMDACSIEHMVNISLTRGAELDAVLRKFAAAPRDRFTLFMLADWTLISQGHTIQALVDELERRVEQGVRGLKVWKDLGLTARDADGELLRIDDERWAPLFDKAAELQIPVMLHLGDPVAFFQPIDARNERYEELAAHPEWGFCQPGLPPQIELMEAQSRLIARHPGTQFIGAHIGSFAENLAWVARDLDRFPNYSLDISARAAELGRQPFTSRKFFLRYADRILFGSDLLPEESMYGLYFRFLETEDEYFPYPTHASGQGRWRIYGLNLPDEVLRAVYHDNAARLLGRPFVA